MPGRKPPTHCKLCGKPATPRRVLSTRGRCGPCAERRIIEAARAMKAKTGPEWDRWQEAMKAAAQQS